MPLLLCLPPGGGDALVSRAHRVHAHLSRPPSRASVSSTLSSCLSPYPPTLCLLVGPAATEILPRPTHLLGWKTVWAFLLPQ